MKTAICDMLGIDIPLLAFTHCRDVVVAVTNAGGFGVFGAMRYTPDELEQELTWIDERVNGRPYGLDLVVPNSFVGKDEVLSDSDLVARVPAEHLDYIQNLLQSHGVDMEREEFVAPKSLGESYSQELLDVAFRHPIKLLANALGVPPQFMIDRAKAEGVPIGALVGSARHAVKQVEAGVDVLIAQGTEAGGHCGEVSTMVLVPEVIEAIKDLREVPVLAAGGIVTGRQMAAAVALGAAGAWTGTVWLTTHEAETAPYTVEKMLKASSRDTVRSKGRTGKPCRQLKSAWTEAWDNDPDIAPLPMPLQSMIANPTLNKIDKLAEKGHAGARELATYYVGQGVGLMRSRKSASSVVVDFATDYDEAVSRLTGSLED